jgi:hypothetical protein
VREPPLKQAGGVNQKKERAAEGRVRTKEPDRSQGWLFKQMPDQLVEPEHPVRAVAAAVEAMELSDFLAKAKAVEGQAGRPPTVATSARWARSPPCLLASDGQPAAACVV